MFRIELENGLSYGRVVHEPVCAFYDGLFVEEPSLDQIVSQKIIFKIWIADYAFKSGRWNTVGNMPLEPDLLMSPRFFIEPIFEPGTFWIIQDGKEIPATREECAGLERAAVWGAEHVEKRLREFYANRDSCWPRQ